MKPVPENPNDIDLKDFSPSLPWVVYRLGRPNRQGQRARIRQAAFTSYSYARVFVRGLIAINSDLAPCLEIKNREGRLPDDSIAGRA
jgi:hypothetical protein